MPVAASCLVRWSNGSTEFSGTLLGFDDYVSKFSRTIPCMRMLFSNMGIIDMVLEDVTEL